jgi:hypothetical protein
MRNLLTLFLLATFSLGLVAGSNPCAPEPGGKGVSPHASCHQAASSAASAKLSRAMAPSSHPSHGRNNCCDILCQHACHGLALAGAQWVHFAVIPVAGEAIAEPHPTFARFAFLIDHVPLA